MVAAPPRRQIGCVDLTETTMRKLTLLLLVLATGCSQMHGPVRVRPGSNVALPTEGESLTKQLVTAGACAATEGVEKTEECRDRIDSAAPRTPEVPGTGRTVPGTLKPKFRRP